MKKLKYLLESSRTIAKDPCYNEDVEVITYDHIDEILRISKEILKSKFSLSVFLIVAFHQAH